MLSEIQVGKKQGIKCSLYIRTENQVPVCLPKFENVGDSSPLAHSNVGDRFDEPGAHHQLKMPKGSSRQSSICFSELIWDTENSVPKLSPVNPAYENGIVDVPWRIVKLSVEYQDNFLME